MLVCIQTRKIKTKGNISNWRNWNRVRPNILLVHDNLLSGVDFNYLYKSVFTVSNDNATTKNTQKQAEN